MKNINKNYKLAASLVCANMLDVRKEVEDLEKGGIDYIHFDVMDGSFVPRFGLHPEMLAAVKSITKIPIDVHLMIDNPELYVGDFIKAGGDIIVVHAESTDHLHMAIKRIRDLGGRAGVAINPATPLSVLDYVLGDIELVMLMAINPGILGHKLIPNMMDKISELAEKLKDYPNMIIEIDGGVSPASAAEMVSRGANLLVCGTSSIFQPPMPLPDKIKEFRAHVDSGLNKMSENHGA
ncbi:MAG: ribulose-phosphate 3-epimerase [Patescibacteria group bacterium]